MSRNKQIVCSMRPLEYSDLPLVSEWLSDLEDLARFDRSGRVPQSTDATRMSWSRTIESRGPDDGYWFAIADAENKPIGIIGLEHVNLINRDAIVPMFIERSHRGKGVGTRSLLLLMDIAFDQLGLRRLTTFLRADNEASRSMTERVGFREEGRMREAWFSGGRNLDMIVAGILRQEWAERRTALADALDSRTIVRFGRIGAEGWAWPPVDRAAQGPGGSSA